MADEENDHPALLTRREADVVNGIFQGQNLNEISSQLDISVNVARTDLHNVYRKRGVKSPLELVALAFKNGGVLF